MGGNHKIIETSCLNFGLRFYQIKILTIQIDINGKTSEFEICLSLRIFKLTIFKCYLF